MKSLTLSAISPSAWAMNQDPTHQDTIVAIATGSGPASIGVIRLSGSLSARIASKMWTSRGCSVDKFASHRIYYGNIVDFSTGNPLDDAIVLFFHGPKSFTGEDVVEFQTHGNPRLMDRIVQLCVEAGARLAEPGEFTRRAFMNGRLDLAQAEAVADVIESSSDAGLRRAHEQLGGRLSQRVAQFLSELTEVRAFVEATIDFPEDDIEMIANEKVLTRIAAMRNDADQLASTYREGKLYRDGALVALVGPPNAGKSSLLNALLGEERALVHHTAGTTRDTLEESMVWGGIPVRCIDTAGLRTIVDDSAHAEVELLGITRAHEVIHQADLRIVVIDGSVQLDAAQTTALTALPRDRVVIWCNKNDQGVTVSEDQLQELFSDTPVVQGSALTQDGLPALRREVVRVLRGSTEGESDGMLITNSRHKVALDNAIAALTHAEQSLKDRMASEFVAEHLRSAADAMGSIVGTVTTEDLLGEIFSQFCIGK